MSGEHHRGACPSSPRRCGKWFVLGLHKITPDAGTNDDYTAHGRMDAPGSAELTAVTSQLRDHSFDDTLAHSRTLPSSLSSGIRSRIATTLRCSKHSLCSSWHVLVVHHGHLLPAFGKGQLLTKRACTAWPSAMVAETTTRAPDPSGWARAPTSLLGSAGWSWTVAVLPPSWTMARAFLVPADVSGLSSDSVRNRTSSEPLTTSST